MSETKTQVGQIRTEVHGHVFKIIIDNVAKKNSFSPQMMAQMSDAMTLLDRTDDYWVGVLCAEGPLDSGKFERQTIETLSSELPRHRRSVTGAGAAASDASQHAAATGADSGSSSLNAPLTVLCESACQS